MQKVLKQSIPARVVAVVLAVLIVLGIAVPMMKSFDVKAETDVFATDTKVYVNDDNYESFGKDVTLYAICYDSSGNVIADSDGEIKCALTADGDGYCFTAFGGTATFEIIRENTALTSKTPGEPIAGNKRRIFFNNTSGMTNVHAYSWFMDGSSAVKGLGAWPGKEMINVTGNYYYIDVPVTDTMIIFNNGAASGALQTDSITISEDKNLYTANTNQWSTYGISSIINVSVTARPNSSANTIYVTGSTSCKWSKYASPLSEALTVAYVYAPAWKNAFVTYDPNDPLTVVKPLQAVTHEGFDSDTTTGYFVAYVPVGSTFMFKPNEGDTAGSTGKLEVPGHLTMPCYNVVTRSWDELDAEIANANYVVGNTFHNNETNILGVKATYYDYLSDEEYNGQWLNPIQHGTGFNKSSDDWYPFFIFNQEISKLAKSNSSTWNYPLYFGNFCNTSGAYNTSNHGSGGWANVTNSQNAYNFHYMPNNSNALSSENASVQGLMRPTLSETGNLMVTDSLPAPYFNNSWLMENDLAKVISADFPFVIEEQEGYKKYSFDSNDAKDNIYFTWDTQGTETYPTLINYGTNTVSSSHKDYYYGIKDGIQYFMNPDDGFRSGYGIFPFNNTSGTKGVKTYSNENLNYGFGIRMDIDFRVPEGGVIPGTDEPILFEFEGDDDLWVYIKDNDDDDDNGRLILDMGGAHKKSYGKIDFKEMVSTVSEAYNLSDTDTNTSEKRYVYLDAKGKWTTPYAYFFNSSGAVNGAWPGKAMTKLSNGNYRFEIPSGATGVVFSGGNGSKQTENIDLTSTNGSYYISGGDGSEQYTVAQWAVAGENSGLSGSSSASAQMKTNVEYDFSSFFDNTDDQKTYTMTVFYMERGLIESNMKINFTMTPLDNDITVANEIDPADLNPGLVDAVLQAEKFGYNISNDNNQVIGVEYITADGDVYFVADTGFNLPHLGSAFFDAKFETGSNMSITEYNTLTGIEYDTVWTLYDNNTGDVLAESNDETSMQSIFDLINASGDSNLRTSLYLGYVNTPKTTNIAVSKAVEDEDGKDISDTSTAVFDYIIALDVDGSGSFKSEHSLDYDLFDVNSNYIATLTAENGKFSLQAGQKAVFNGMPKGAKYKVTEAVKSGYELGSIAGGANAVVNGYSVSADIADINDILYTNIYKPVSTALSANKTLAGESYTGTDFTFKLEGLDKMTLGSETTKDTKDVSLEVSSVANGVVGFANTTEYSPFTYGEEGIYCYKISEVNDGKAGYIYDDTVFYAKIVVTADNDGVLTVNEAKYYSDSSFSTEISSAEVVFKNKYKPVEAELTLNKTLDTAPYTGTEFEFKAEGVSDNTANTSMTVNTSENGKVTFKNTSDNKMFEFSKPGTYCYKLYEVKDENNMDYIYDETPYFAKVSVTAGENGVLSASVSYYTDSAFTAPANDVTIANESALCKVYVYKKSSLNGTTSLEGAEFELRTASPDEAGGWVEDTDSTYTSGPQTTREVELEDGTKVIAAVFENIPQGDYVVVETKAPVGYELSPLTPYVNVRKTAENNAEVHIDFIDYESQPLPLTGGSGFAFGTAAAISIFGVAAICWLVSKKPSKKGVHYR